MAKARNIGSGWHYESLRHSHARRFGKATPSNRIKTLINQHPEYKKLTFKQLQHRGVYLKYQGDSDKDGIKNVHDCRPLDKTRQDNGMSKEEKHRFNEEYESDLRMNEKYEAEQHKKELELASIEKYAQKKGIVEKVKEALKKREADKIKNEAQELKSIRDERIKLEGQKKLDLIYKREKESLAKVKKELSEEQHAERNKKIEAIKAFFATQKKTHKTTHHLHYKAHHYKKTSTHHHNKKKEKWIWE
jgi:phage-related minor tail protein